MRPLKFFSACAALALLAGCAGYHFGPVTEGGAGEKTVEIFPFNNQTPQPRLGIAVTQALRERLQADATYQLATSGPGDIVVTGDITGFKNEGLSYLNNDVTTAENYHIGIVAHVVARERDSGRVLFDQDVSGDALTHVGTDLASAERQSQTALAEDLANKIAELLTDRAW